MWPSISIGDFSANLQADITLLIWSGHKYITSHAELWWKRIWLATPMPVPEVTKHFDWWLFNKSFRPNPRPQVLQEYGPPVCENRCCLKFDLSLNCFPQNSQADITLLIWSPWADFKWLVIELFHLKTLGHLGQKSCFASWFFMWDLMLCVKTILEQTSHIV